MIDLGNVTGATQQQYFSDWLKCIGEGTETIYQKHGDNAIQVPEDI